MVERDLVEPQALIAMLRAGQAPPEVRLYAARGLLPLDREDRIRALLAVLEDPDPGIGLLAKKTFEAISPEEFSGFVRTGAPTELELDSLASSTQDSIVVEQVIRDKNVSDMTLERLARTVSGGPQEALVINQARLLRQPSLIDALFENPELTADTRRRLLEIREEFFDKGQRRREAEEARIAAEPALAEAERQAAEDLAALSAQEAAAITGGPKVADADKSITTGAVYRRIAVMTVSEKIKLAYSGGKEERRILMGDANKLVGGAVLKGRGITLPEIESFCGMRHLHEELFRKIAGAASGSAIPPSSWRS
ncbi:MAG TPA: hypothetical protein VK780_09680 [Thermoanaerobaculia bacterium]|nr:hypothetical protein [Thermoanaerobaculia bacterium]